MNTEEREQYQESFKVDDSEPETEAETQRKSARTPRNLRLRRFINLIETLPRLCTPTICGTVNVPGASLTDNKQKRNNHDEKNRGNNDAENDDILENGNDEDYDDVNEKFEWSIDQLAVLEPANITVDSLSTEHFDVANLDLAWRTRENEQFFSQQTIIPSPSTQTVQNSMINISPEQQRTPDRLNINLNCIEGNKNSISDNVDYSMTTTDNGTTESCFNGPDEQEDQSMAQSDEEDDDDDNKFIFSPQELEEFESHAQANHHLFQNQQLRLTLSSPIVPSSLMLDKNGCSTPAIVCKKSNIINNDKIIEKMEISSSTPTTPALNPTSKLSAKFNTPTTTIAATTSCLLNHGTPKTTSSSQTAKRLPRVRRIHV